MSLALTIADLIGLSCWWVLHQHVRQRDEVTVGAGLAAFPKGGQRGQASLDVLDG